MSDRTDRTVFGSALAELRLGEPTHAEGVTVLPLVSPAVLEAWRRKVKVQASVLYRGAAHGTRAFRKGQG